MPFQNLYDLILWKYKEAILRNVFCLHSMEVKGHQNFG